METLNVAVVTSKSRYLDVSANVRHFADLVRKAADRGARLVCFPELALSCYTTDKAILEAAEKIPGPVTEELCRIAAECDVYVSAGMPEKAGSKYHIGQIVVGPGGYLGKYRKYHPTGSEEAAGFSPGKSFPTFDIDGFKMGVNICFDGRHEDTIEAMKRAKVDLIHHPHGNGIGLGRDAEEWTRGKMSYFVPRAVHARCYILINNSAGDTPMADGPFPYGSGALILDPLGQVVARTTQKTRTEKMVIGTLVKPLSELIPEHEMRMQGIRGT